MRFFAPLLFVAFLVFAYGKEETKNLNDDLPLDLLKKYSSSTVEKTLDNLIKEATTKNGDNEDLRISKNGFILGTGVWLKEFTVKAVADSLNRLTAETPSLNTGLILGYQFYMGKVLGVRISAMGQVGGSADAKIKASKIVPANQATTRSPQEYHQSYISVSAGVEAALLLDLVTTQKHSFGIDGGVGYNAEWYIPNSDKGNINKLITKPSILINSGLYPFVGIHYYFKNHQFGVSYKFVEYALTNKDIWHPASGYRATFRSNAAIRVTYLYRF